MPAVTPHQGEGRDWRKGCECGVCRVCRHRLNRQRRQAAALDAEDRMLDARADAVWQVHALAWYEVGWWEVAGRYFDQQDSITRIANYCTVYDILPTF